MMNWARWLLGLPLRTVAGCKRKVRYREASARKAAVRMEQKTGWKFDAYQCPHCDGWQQDRCADDGGRSQGGFP